MNIPQCAGCGYSLRGRGKQSVWCAACTTIRSKLYSKRWAKNIGFFDVKRMFDRQGSRCALCQTTIYFSGGQFHMDHKKPFSRGGSIALGNMQLTCPSCNLKKNCDERWQPEA